MTLCEALDWCRTHHATVKFEPTETTLSVGVSINNTQWTGSTLEEVVEQALAYSLRSMDIIKGKK